MSTPESLTNLDVDAAMAQLALMHRIRAFELTAIDALKEGLVLGAIHPSIGQEGIAAGVVMDIEDVCKDETLLARGALVNLPHPILGEFGHVRTPIDFSGSSLAPFRAPGMGEHNAEIVTDIAGLSEQRLAELIESGVLQ